MVIFVPRNWFGFLLLGGLGVYSVGLNIAHYSDDFMFIFDPPPSDPAYFFTHVNDGNPLAYRPIEATTLAVIQANFGTRTWPMFLAEWLLRKRELLL
ncbi:MAG TPA: hypothetical protein VN641_03425 [Urbifossiella sp.]|nr:hypothetical protein [Urbifossiella sp.]